MDRRIHSWLQYSMLAIICAIQAWQTYQILERRAQVENIISTRFSAADGATMAEKVNTLSRYQMDIADLVYQNAAKMDTVLNRLILIEKTKDVPGDNNKLLVEIIDRLKRGEE